MGIKENRYATEIRRRLLSPPNGVPDPGIDLKRKNQPPPQPEPQALPPEPAPTETPPSSCKVLPFIPRNLSLTRLIGLIALHSGFPAADLLGASRKFDLTLARHTAIWLCLRYFPKRSLMQLAKVFNRDHTSIIHGRDRIRRYIDSASPEGVRIRALIESVEGDINDCSRFTLPNFNEFDMALRAKEGIQEPEIPPMGERSMGSLAKSEEEVQKT